MIDMPNGLRCSLASVALRGLNGAALDGHAGMPTGGIGGAGGGSGVVGTMTSLDCLFVITPVRPAHLDCTMAQHSYIL